MKKLIILLIIISSNIAFGKTQTDMQDLMHSYLHSIKTADKAKLKEVVSDNYYKMLSKDGQLDQLFKRQKQDGKKIEFDLKFQKYHNKKDQFLVNIKDKSKSDYGHYWYVVILKNGKYKILKEEYLD